MRTTLKSTQQVWPTTHDLMNSTSKCSDYSRQDKWEKYSTKQDIYDNTDPSIALKNHSVSKSKKS